MNKKTIENIINTLIKEYPEAECSLNFTNPLELLIAVILSAQSTDAMINKITPALFDKYPTAQDLADADIKELEHYVKSSGFYHNKAKNIKNACIKLVELYDGNVPENMEELTALPGVGRKTANVVMLNAFNKCEGIAVDTHAKRLSNRIGFSSKEEPLKIEQDLLEILPKKYWAYMNHLFVYHGRTTCTARNPKCEACCIKGYCKKEI